MRLNDADLELNNLPSEILLRIATDVVKNPRDGDILNGLDDLANLEAVNKNFNQIANDASVWNEAARAWNQRAPSIGFKITEPEQGVLSTVKYVWKSFVGTKQPEKTVKQEMLDFITHTNQKALQEIPSIHEEENPFVQYHQVITQINEEVLKEFPNIPKDKDSLKQYELINHYFKENLENIRNRERQGRPIEWTGVKAGLSPESMFILHQFDDEIFKANSAFDNQLKYTDFIFQKLNGFLQTLYGPQNQNDNK